MIPLKLGEKGQGRIAIFGGFLILASLGQMYTISKLANFINQINEQLSS